MHPVLFDFGFFKVYAFGAIVATAFLVGALWFMRRAKAAGESPDLFFEAAFWLMLAGLVGGKLFYFIFFPAAFLADPLAALLSTGGLVWYGGMLFGIIAAVVFVRVKKLSFQKFGDLLAPPAALGLGIGRLGCLMAGCCYGAVTGLPWGIRYPHGHVTFPEHVHPSPLYESFAMILVAGLLAWVDRHKRFEGLTGWMFVVLYGIVRFVLEYYRGDRLVWIEALNLSASQVFSLLGVLAGAGMIVFLKQRNYESQERPAESPTVQQ